MTPKLVVFEDARWRELRPLTDLVPVGALAFGGSCLAERIAQRAGLPLVGIAARADAMAVCGTLPQTAGGDAAGEVVAVNAAALPGPWLAPFVTGSGPERLRTGERLVAARIPAGTRRSELPQGEGFESSLAGLALPDRQVEAQLLEHPWQLVGWNAAAIAEDLARQVPGLRGDVHRSAVVLDEGRVQVEPGARVDPLAVLDAREGPILVRRGAVIGAHTIVVGPCVVGERTQLLGGVIARSTIGRECRIAGEVEECVWQGFSNKRHHGFVGHSVIGEWVNLGALTTTSDLKNNYGPVRVWIEGRERDTGISKLGSLVGAHVKTGIGTLLPTGAAIGTGSNLFGGGRFAPRAMPSFAWWDGERTEEHRLDAFLNTAAVAMSRRGERLTEAAEAALRRLFEATMAERGVAAPR